MSPITNDYGPETLLPPLPTERAFLYRPETEWTYSHHPHLTVFRGRYMAMWSNGWQDEDAPGQRVLMATSADGREWNQPIPLLDVTRGQSSDLVLTAAGWHVAGETLVAYVGSYEYRPEFLREGQRQPGDQGHTNTGLWALTSRDGLNWSKPLDMGLPIVPNHGPQKTASGRLIISGNIMFPFSDDASGIGPWTPAGLYRANAPVIDDSEGFWRVKDEMGWPVGLCEGAFYQTDDKVLHMLLRSNTDRLWVTESADDGVSWSPPAPTGFTDNGTKFHFGRLPDGRFYYVGCPDPENSGRRCPLVLSLSEDGRRFNRHYVLADTPYAMRRPGLHKGGEYCYTHTLLHDGRLHVIVSRQKEAVEVLRVDVRSL